MFANLQNAQNTAQPFGSQPSTGGFGLFNNQTQTNAFNNTPPQPGNIFGAQTQQTAQPFGGQPAQGQGLFGGANQNSNANPAVPAFGTGNNVFGNNQTSQSAFGAFGQNQTSNVFGNNQNQSSLPSFGTSNNAFGATPAQGTGVFGSNQTQGQNTNLFSGNTQPQQSGGSIFGNTQQQPAFSNGSGTPFGNNNTGGSIFGGAGNNAANTGGNVFGSFGNNNTNNNFANKGVFGQTFGANNNAASPFGGANNNTTNVFGAGNTGTPFGNNQGPSIFGGTSNNNTGLAFGNNNQQPQNNMFGANTSQPFGNNPATTNQQFGAFGQTTSTSIFNKSPANNAFNNTPPKGPSILGGTPNQTFAFGNNALNQQNQAFSTQSTNQNAFGNTTWGVPTNGAIAVGGAQPAKFTALKPKNAKIDGKHLVKCITLLDQNTNFCKNQLRIRHIMTGGQVPGQTVGNGFGQPVGGGQGFFGNGSVNANANTSGGLGFSFSKQQGNAFGQQQTGAFGQQTNAFGQQQNNTFGQQQTNAFGQQQSKPFGQQNNAFGTTSTLFGGQQGFQNATQPVAGGAPTLFGGNSAIGATGGSGLFGNNNAAQPTNTGFGIGLNSNPTTPTNTGLFGGGNNTAFKPAGNLFGGNTAPQTPAFGGTQQPSGGFSLGLGNQNQQQPAAGATLFGSNPATNLFGGSTTGMFSGLSQPAQISTQTPQGTQGSLFGGGLSSNQPQTSSGLSFGFNAQPSTTPTLFGQKTGPQPSPTLFGNQSTPNLSGMFSSTPTAQNSQNLASQGIFSDAFQVQSQAQAQAKALFGGQPGSTPSGTITQGSDLATILLNGLFNTEFFKKLVTSQNTPFDSLKMEARKRNEEKKQDFFGQKITNSEDDLSVGYIPRYNKNHKAMYSSLLNFNQSPYMYNQISNESKNEIRQTQKLRQRFNNKNQKFEPKILSERRPERPIVNERTSQVRPQPQPSTSKNQVQRKSKQIANEQDLPKIEKKYKIEPSLQQLKQKTSEQLKRVPNVQIWNQHGKIVFKSPINLYKKVISDCVFIGENTIDINDVEWDDKKCQLYFYDFGGYSNMSSEEDKAKLEKKMRKWIKKNGMHQHSFDKGTGTLHVEIF